MAYFQNGDKERAKKELQAALSISDTFMGAEEAKKVLENL
jgi:Tfp pilus assembly protein PilF